jgi:hypothetical protein
MLVYILFTAFVFFIGYVLGWMVGKDDKTERAMKKHSDDLLGCD